MEDKYSNLNNKHKKVAPGKDIDISKLSENEIKRIIHDFESNQFKLEVQNAELKETQRDLEISRNKYFELFEFAPVSFVSLDGDLKVINSNASFSELSKYPKQEVSGRKITDFITPDFHNNFHQAFSRLLKNGKKQSLELKLNCHPNSEKWVYVEFNSRNDGKSFLLSFSDISEQKKINEALKTSEAKLKAVINNFPDGSINLINKEHEFELVGGAGYEKHSINAASLIGKPVKNILAKELAELAEDGINHAFNGKTKTYEVGYDGATYRNVVCPVNSNESHIDYALLISLNITDKIKTQNELRSAKEKAEENQLLLKKITDNFPNSFVSVVEKDFTISFTGGEEFSKLNLDPNTFIGKPLNEILSNSTTYLIEQHRKAFEGESVSFEFKFNNMYQQYNIVPLKENNGQINRILAVVENITERKEAEIELKVAKEQAEENEAMLQAALGNSQAGIAIADVPTGKLRFVNKAGLLVRDKDHDEIVKDVDVEEYVSSWQILHFDGTPFEKEEVPLARAVLYGETCSKEFIVRRDNNEDRYVWANAGPIINKAGIQIAAIVVFLDITDRKLAENDLAESESRFRSLFDNSLTGIFYINKSGEILEANPKILELLGSPSSDATKRINVLTFKPLVENGYADDFKKAIDTKKVVFGEAIYKSKWGKTMHVRYYFNPIKRKDEVIGVLANVEDVSELRKAEKQIAESEERLRLAMNGAADGVWDWNIISNDIYYSPNWKKMLGYKDHELENKVSVWEECTNPAQAKIAWKKLNRYVKGKNKQFKVEFKMKHKKGHWIDVLSRAVAIDRDSNGKASRIVGTHVDITEHKKIQETLATALKNSKKKQLEITELLHATHSILSTSDFEKAANEIFQACKRSIGAKAGYIALLNSPEEQKELLFLNDNGLTSGADSSLIMLTRSLRTEVYKNSQVVYNNNFMKNKLAKSMPYGHIDLMNVLFAPLIIHGKAVGVLALSNKETDFTASDANLASAFAEYAAIALLNSQTLENLEKRAEELQQLNATKDKLFSIIGHDLKNPLTNIINLAKTIERDYDKMPENLKHKSTELLNKSARTASDLLNDLLTWSRSQQGEIEIYREKINLSKIVNNCFELLEGTAQRKNIELNSQVPNPTTAFADEKMITTIIRNLLSNAIKFTNEGGIVEVLTKNLEKEVILEVNDSGIGMDKVLLSSLFQLDDKHSSKGTAGESGTGLGLIICKDFIEKENGKIWAESEPDKGSSFFISIPKNN